MQVIDGIQGGVYRLAWLRLGICISFIGWNELKLNNADPDQAERVVIIDVMWVVKHSKREDMRYHSPGPPDLKKPVKLVEGEA